MNQYSAWCRNLMAMLTDGGAWGVPRSGLTFTKKGDYLVLTKRDAYDRGVHPYTKKGWETYQQEDYERIWREFALAGIVVSDETGETK